MDNTSIVTKNAYNLQFSEIRHSILDGNLKKKKKTKNKTKQKTRNKQKADSQSLCLQSLTISNNFSTVTLLLRADLHTYLITI
jgi:hypothetical protein